MVIYHHRTMIFSVLLEHGSVYRGVAIATPRGERELQQNITTVLSSQQTIPQMNFL